MLGQAAARLSGRAGLSRPVLDPGLVRQLAAALVFAALLETALLRLTTRIGVHVPRESGLDGAFEAASALGSLAFNFASILALGLVVVVLGTLTLRLERGIGQLAMAALSLALLLGFFLSLATGAAAADAIFGLAATLLVGLIGLFLYRREGMTTAGRIALALIVGAYFCYQYYTLGQLTAQRLLDYTTLPPLSLSVLRLGEALVVLASGAVFLAWGASRWRHAGPAGIGAAAVAVVALGLAALSPASTASILALWTTGLSLFLPFPIYLLALGLYLVTLIACWRSGDAFWPAAGLLLVLLAGYMPEATYHHLLVLLGVAFASGVAAEGIPPLSRSA